MRSVLMDESGRIVHRRWWGGTDRVVGIVGRVIDLLFALLYFLLLVRFTLQFLGAHESAGFYQLIRRATDVFYGPFQGLFPTATVWHGQVSISMLVAVATYVVLHAFLRRVLMGLSRA